MMARNFHFSAACVPLQKVVNKFAFFSYWAIEDVPILAGTDVHTHVNLGNFIPVHQH